MQLRTISAVTATSLVALVLAGCSATDTTPTKSPAATASGSAEPGGVADPTGTCIDGVATPMMTEKTYTLDDCATVDVMGSGNTITLGVVEQLTLEGSNNTVIVDEVTEVTNIGKDNTVTYGGGEPALNELGSGTEVTPSSAGDD